MLLLPESAGSNQVHPRVAIWHEHLLGGKLGESIHPEKHWLSYWYHSTTDLVRPESLRGPYTTSCNISRSPLS